MAFKLTIKQQSLIVFEVIALIIKFWKILVGVRITTTEPYRGTGDVLDIKGQLSVSCMLEGYEFKQAFLVCSFPTVTKVLVGADFMTSLGAVIDLECGMMVLTSKRKLPRGYCVPPTGHMALTLFSEDKEGRSPRRRKRENRRANKQIPTSPRPESERQKNALSRQGYRQSHGSTQVSASSIRKVGV